MIFTRRRIDVSVSGQGVQNVALTGHRTSARIIKAGEYELGNAEITIYGMTQALMNQLTTYGTYALEQNRYDVIVMAGDDVNGMSMVFKGTVKQAWADYQAMPNVPFHIMAFAGGYAQVQQGTPSSFTGSADVVVLMQQLAGQAGFGFQNHGVTTKLDNPYFYGSPGEQIKQVAAAANIRAYIDEDTLHIWPQDGDTGDSGLVISEPTGMVSEPTFTELGVLVRAEFTKNILYGSNFTIKSNVTPANGSWKTYRIDYDLQALVPKGHWFVELLGWRNPAIAPVAGATQ